MDPAWLTLPLVALSAARWTLEEYRDWRSGETDLPHAAFSLVATVAVSAVCVSLADTWIVAAGLVPIGWLSCLPRDRAYRIATGRITLFPPRFVPGPPPDAGDPALLPAGPAAEVPPPPGAASPPAGE